MKGTDMERRIIDNADVQVYVDPATGGVTQLVLYGTPLLAAADPAETEIAVNDLPFRVRSEAAELRRQCGGAVDSVPLEQFHTEPGAMVGERFINQYAGFGLEVTRHLRADAHLQRLTLRYQVNRVPAAPTCPVPGPGGPAIEARAYIDTFSVPRWQWQFWGDDTRMLHLSLHCSGPDGDFGHIGYNRGTVAEVKQSMQNIWRRQYPGVMALHGAVYYAESTDHWVAISCRKPMVGYYLDLDNAGLGLSYNYTLHDDFHPGQTLALPEIVIRYGRTRAEMEQYIRDYTTQHWHDVPAWNSRTTWFNFALWEPFRNWQHMWSALTPLIDNGACTGLGPYMMLHHWARAQGGTSPLGYEPDPAMGPREDFEAGALAMQARGVPLGVWLSHSGLMPGRDIDEDWFVRGVDDGWSASWGSRRHPGLVTINPGHPGYIAYTKQWMQYYIGLGFRWFFFDCGGWAMPPDYRPRSFMRFPGDTGLMSVRFYEEIVPFARSLDPGVIISGEGFSSDFPIHVCGVNHNPVHSTDGLGPRDYLLAMNRLPGKRIVIDQSGALVPASGMCTLPGPEQALPGAGIDEKLQWVAAHPMFQAITAFVREHGIDGGEHLPGDYSIIDDHFFAPWKYTGAPIALPERYADCRALAHAVTGAAYPRAADGTLTLPEPGLYRMLHGK
jgi:hypothetical protein